MGLRNSLVAKKLSEELMAEKAEMSEFDKLRRQYNRSAVVAKKFPVQGYRYPNRGLNKKLNPLYMTSSM